VLAARSPSPAIVKRLYTGIRPRPARRFEQHIIARIRIERRVELDQVHTLIRKRFFITQDFQIVAIIKLVRHAA
jgi:hypothetical protein